MMEERRKTILGMDKAKPGSGIEVRRCYNCGGAGFKNKRQCCICKGKGIIVIKK